MRHLLKGAWFYVAQLTVYWNTLNKNINTGEETWRPLGTPDPNAGWINSNLAPFSLRMERAGPFEGSTEAKAKPRCEFMKDLMLLSQAMLSSCRCLTSITQNCHPGN